MSVDDETQAAGDEEDTNSESIPFLSTVNLSSDRHSTQRRPGYSIHRVFKFVVAHAILTGVSILLYEVLRRHIVQQGKSVTLLPGAHVIPSFERNTIVQFEFNETFAANHSFKAWHDLQPKGGGWITVENGERLGLGPPIRHNNLEGYGISVFHQLHCMAMIHHAYFQFSVGGEHMTGGSVDRSHIDHCFDYVRQALMCQADLSLEHRQDSENARSGDDLIDGWGVLHQCRDWDAIVHFVETDR